MPDNNEKTTINKRDLDFILSVERIKERQALNEGLLHGHIKKTELSLVKILEAVQNNPHEILKCKTELWTEVEKNFLTIKAADDMEKRIESKIGEVKNKLSWTLGIIVFVATIASQFVVAYISSGSDNHSDLQDSIERLTDKIGK